MRPNRVNSAGSAVSTVLLNVLAIAIMLWSASVADAQDVAQDAAAQDVPPLPVPYVQAFSGSPLLLEVGILDPEAQIVGVRIDSGASTQEYSVPDDAPREPLILRVSPFFGSGSYELEITLRARDGRELRDTLTIGFVDFVWGRDNLSFGNNGDYHSVIGSFGEVLADWIDDRFGEVPTEELVLLTDYMYGLFGRNTGRCYAFAGTEVRYWRWPELLPSYYDETHDLRSNVPRYQREMNYLQFDIVFDHFLAGPGAEQIARPMTREELAEQAREAEARITADQPVAVGFAGPDLHHSMLVFGFIRNEALETIDLLVANNWKSDEKLNIHSRDAEIVRIHLAEDHQGARVVWRYDDGVRDRDIDRLFVVDVPRDPAVHDRAVLEGLIAQLADAFLAEDRIRVVVEDAAGALLTDGEHTVGRLRSRVSNEIEGVWWERVGHTYRFSFPPELSLLLEVIPEGEEDPRILAIAPREDSDQAIAVLQPVRASEPEQDGTNGDDSDRTHRLILQPAGTVEIDRHRLQQ